MESKKDSHILRLSSLQSQYVGQMGVGTKVKPNGKKSDESKVWVVFDTGSTNIWVASDLCESGACTMKGRQRYNHTRSVTFGYPANPAQLTVEFGTGRLK